MRKLLKHRATKILLEIGIFLLLYFAVRAYMQWQLASGPVPAVQAVTLSGTGFDTAVPRKGPLLIHFWATWCPVCHLEQKSIDAISQDYSVMSIAMNSGEAAEVMRFLKEQGLSFPVINDPDGAIAKRFGVNGVPVSFVVDTHNQIRYVERGYTTEWGLRLRLWLSS
ncbi:MAG: redoxin family protein [Gammaproteobacteria bacterium]|nr:redoxin family protein [Gammaproteobacteria bacterium]